MESGNISTGSERADSAGQSSSSEVSACGSSSGCSEDDPDGPQLDPLSSAALNSNLSGQL